MNISDHVRVLIAYNRWANERLIEKCELMDSDDYLGRVHLLMAHILGAQQTWLDRFEGVVEKRETPTDLAELMEGFESSHSALDWWAGGFQDRDWERMLAYRSSDGEAHYRPLGELVAHLVNHGTYHRGEIAAIVTQAGHSPGDLDYLYRIPDQEPPTA